MAITVINLVASTNGSPTDIGGVTMEALDGSYGVKALDDQASIYPPGAAFVEQGDGIYQFVINDSDDHSGYTYSIRIVYNGVPKYYVRTVNANQNASHVYSIPSESYYSSEAEVMRIIGDAGIQAMMEDWAEEDTEPLWTQLLTTVDSIFDAYCGQHYTPPNMKDDVFVRTNATLMTAHFLMIRRGNPSPYLREIERIYDMLNDIRSGRLHLKAKPNGRKAPVVVNYKMQGMSLHPVKIIKSKSMGTPSYQTPAYAWEPYFGRYWV